MLWLWASAPDPADDLVQRLLGYAMAPGASGLGASSELGPPDLATVGFFYELGDIHQRRFG